MTELQKAVALVEYARDTAELLHSTFVRVKLDEALAHLYKVQVEQEESSRCDRITVAVRP